MVQHTPTKGQTNLMGRNAIARKVEDCQGEIVSLLVYLNRLRLVRAFGAADAAAMLHIDRATRELERGKAHLLREVPA